MSGSSNSPSWMLPLLLLSLFVCFSNSRRTTRTPKYCRLYEFGKDMETLGEALKNCSKNCSSVPITAKECQCFNLSVSKEERNFTAYFTKGLELLSLKSESVNKPIENLKQRLSQPLKWFNNIFGLMESKSDLSPISFWEELQGRVQEMNAYCATITSSNQ